MTLLTRTVTGQGQSAASIELNKSQSLWFNSRNAAGMTINPLYDYNILSAGYTNMSGEYKSLQRGDREDEARVNTNGALSIGRIHLWGDFSFVYDYLKGTRYNTSSFSPSFDMPYYVADPNKGDWNKQRYDMTVKAAFPLIGNVLAFGGRVNYLTYKGAKQIDPRGVPIGYAVELEPALLVRLSDKHSLGATFIYRNGFERTSFSNVQGNSTMVYLLKGLGSFSSGSVAGTGGIGNYYYPANTFGGSLQYGFHHGGLRILVEGGYRHEKIDAFQNPTIAYRMGTIDSDRIDSGVRLAWGKKNFQKFSALFSMTDVKGTEYLQEQTSGGESDKPYKVLATLDMSDYSHMEASASYDIYVRRADLDDYTWNVGASLEYGTRNDRYNNPVSTFSYQNALSVIHARRNLRIKERNRLSFMAEGGYRKNLGGKYEYNGSDSEHELVTEFYASEHALYSSDYSLAGWEVAYSHSYDKSAINFKVYGRYQFSGGKSRSLSGVTLSYMF